MAAYDTTEAKEAVERVTAGHYVDQIRGSVSHIHELLDKVDGGVPADGPGQVSAAGLIGDLEALGHGVRAVEHRLQEIVARLGRVL